MEHVEFSIIDWDNWEVTLEVGSVGCAFYFLCDLQAEVKPLLSEYLKVFVTLYFDHELLMGLNIIE